MSQYSPCSPLPCSHHLSHAPHCIQWLAKREQSLKINTREPCLTRTPLTREIISLLSQRITPLALTSSLKTPAASQREKQSSYFCWFSSSSSPSPFLSSSWRKKTKTTTVLVRPRRISLLEVWYKFSHIFFSYAYLCLFCVSPRKYVEISRTWLWELIFFVLKKCNAECS